MNADPTHAFALHDPASWAIECAWIEKMADMRLPPAFESYCIAQRDLAAERGFDNARVRIQQTINRLRNER